MRSYFGQLQPHEVAPSKGSPLFDLGDDEMEMGVGIHREPGRRREKLASSDEITDELLEAVSSDLPYQSGDEVALMVNDLGGTPISELYIVYGRAHQKLADAGVNLTRSYVGEYCPTRARAGASLTRCPRRRAQPALRRARRSGGPHLLSRERRPAGLRPRPPSPSWRLSAGTSP